MYACIYLFSIASSWIPISMYGKPKVNGKTNIFQSCNEQNCNCRYLWQWYRSIRIFSSSKLCIVLFEFMSNNWELNCIELCDDINEIIRTRVETEREWILFGNLWVTGKTRERISFSFFSFFLFLFPTWTKIISNLTCILYSYDVSNHTSLQEKSFTNK